MAAKLKVSDLFTLERYARERSEFRRKVLDHKRSRHVSVGSHVSWLFEDRLTIQYQVQEMLRAERIFEPEGIAEELAAYNPLIPDGRNWKATLLIEYPEPAERRARLEELKGIERRCWMRVGELNTIWAIADEDLDRENEEKTSAVHFLRFELEPTMIQALREGAPLSAGIDHPHYRHALQPVPDATRAALLADLD
jgi:hypothetical protein